MADRLEQMVEALRPLVPAGRVYVQYQPDPEALPCLVYSVVGSRTEDAWDPSPMRRMVVRIESRTKRLAETVRLNERVQQALLAARQVAGIGSYTDVWDEEFRIHRRILTLTLRTTAT